MMTPAEIKVIPEYFFTYTSLVPQEISLSEALVTYGIQYLDPEMEKYKSLGDQVYAKGKWTLKEILAHLIDSERVFAYRALRFARGDQAHLAGFEQDDYVLESNASNRTVDELYQEFKVVRESSICLFNSLNDKMLQRSGTASDNHVSVVALGFIICGHVIHHQRIIEERYYPLLSPQKDR